jgi:hypothetical protein
VAHCQRHADFSRGAAGARLESRARAMYQERQGHTKKPAGPTRGTGGEEFRVKFVPAAYLLLGVLEALLVLFL